MCLSEQCFVGLSRASEALTDPSISFAELLRHAHCTAPVNRERVTGSPGTVSAGYIIASMMPLTGTKVVEFAGLAPGPFAGSECQ